MEALDVVARLAQVRERTRAELATRLEAKGFGAKDIEAALLRAVELGYIDNRRAAMASRERWRARGGSRAFIEQKLATAGVAPGLIAELLVELPSDRALAVEALERRPTGTQARSARWLASKGYNSALIEELLGD